MEEFIENEDLNDYMFNSLPEDYKLSDEQAEIIASVSMNSFLAGIQIGIMDAFEKINIGICHREAEMVNEENIQNDAERDGERRLLLELARDYKRDLAEIESSLEEC